MMFIERTESATLAASSMRSDPQHREAACHGLTTAPGWDPPVIKIDARTTYTIALGSSYARWIEGERACERGSPSR